MSHACPELAERVLRKAFAPDPFCGAPSLRSACTCRTTPVLPSDHSGISSLLFCAPQNPNLPAFIFLRTLSRKTPGVGGRGVKMRSSRILYANSCTINTYRKSACNTCRMNTYETKDLKFSRINTYKKTGGEGLSARLPARGAFFQRREVRRGGFSPSRAMTFFRSTQTSGLAFGLRNR